MIEQFSKKLIIPCFLCRSIDANTLTNTIYKFAYWHKMAYGFIKFLVRPMLGKNPYRGAI